MSTMQAPRAPYAARLSVDYPERLDRVTTFFRLIWIIPIALVLGLLTASGNQTMVTAPANSWRAPAAASWPGWPPRLR